MFHARAGWEGTTLAAVPAGAAFVPARARRDGWVVDLGDQLFSRRWWRGLATLGLLVTTTAMLAPPIEALPSAPADGFDPAAADQFGALGITPNSAGATSGRRMAPDDKVVPLLEAPRRTALHRFASLAPGDTLGRLLVRLGASRSDAAAADALLRTAAPRRPSKAISVEVTLGQKAGEARPVEQVMLAPAMDLSVEIRRGAEGLTLVRHSRPVDRRPLRLRGRVGEGLYWSLRAAGVPASAAADYLKALSGQLDVGADIAPGDRFDLIIAARRTEGGDTETGPLLYAGLDRTGGRDLQLLKWNDGSGTLRWFEATGVGQPSQGMTWPVQARISSGFGMRVHPILRFARMHRGLDFAAGWGAPIVAAADGRVTRAGWAGGYGRQVRLAHEAGLATSYSHMSRIVVAEGSAVRQGQLIGYVGTSGLSTGPHLHYEVYRGGTAVNPMGVKFAGAARLGGPDLAAFRARLAQLTGASRPAG